GHSIDRIVKGGVVAVYEHHRAAPALLDLARQLLLVALTRLEDAEAARREVAGGIGHDGVYRPLDRAGLVDGRNGNVHKGEMRVGAAVAREDVAFNVGTGTGGRQEDAVLFGNLALRGGRDRARHQPMVI